MNGFCKHPVRVCVRLLWLAGEILLALLDFVVNVIFRPKIPLLRARAQWLQQACRRILRVLGVEFQTQGQIPLRGLLVSPQLSYLDVLVIGTITPAVFISKSEVKRWLIFGWFAQLAGSIFAPRARRVDLARINREVGNVLDAGGLIVSFPEETGSDGRRVLPFESSLLEPAIRWQHPLSVAFIRYSLPGGRESEVAGAANDPALAPPLIDVLSRERIGARISFTQLESGPACRKQLAAQLQSHVLRSPGPASATKHALA